MKFLSSRKAIVENNSCLIEFKKQLFIKTKKKNALNVAGVGVFVIELKIGKKENGKMYYKKETVSDELFRNIYSVLCCSYYTLGLFQMFGRPPYLNSVGKNLGVVTMLRQSSRNTWTM